MRIEHHMRRDGTPIPAEIIQAQLAKSQESRAKSMKARRQVKPAKTPTPTGDYVCPECRRFSHKHVVFKTAFELGKHRRFKHNVKGQSSTAKKSRRLTLENRMKAGEILPAAPAPTPTPAPDEHLQQCPHCPRRFTPRGLNKHITAAHPETSNQVEMEIEDDGINGKENGLIPLPQTKRQRYCPCTRDCPSTCYCLHNRNPQRSTPSNC